MTTFLLNVHNAGLYELDSMIMSMGIFYGGIAQIIAGIMEWKKNNIFGFIAFLSYGLFWNTLIFIFIIPKMGVGKAPSEYSLAFYMFIWGLFSLGMFVASLKSAPRILSFLFFTVVVLFWLLSLHFFTESVACLRVAGYEGIICGLLAIYTAFGELLNATYGRTILPLFP